MKKLWMTVFAVVVTLASATAARYTIKRLNTPSLTVDGRELKVGDTFGGNARITWKSGRQAAKLLSDDNKIYVITGRTYGTSGAVTFADFVAGYKSLSTRGDDYPVSVADHAALMNGDFVLLDSLKFPTTWTVDENSFFARLTPGGLKRLPSAGGDIAITRADVAVSDGEDVLKVVYVERQYGDTTLIADRLRVIVVPEHM